MTAISVVASGGVVASAIEPAAAATIVSAIPPRLGIPVVIGVAAVGGRVSVDHGLAPMEEVAPGFGVEGNRPLATYSHQWLADGKPLKGETTGELEVGTALAGKRLSFRVSARLPFGHVATATSLETPRVLKPGIITAVRKSINPESGNSRFALQTSGWPEGTSLRFQWTIDSLPVKGATGRTFELQRRAHSWFNLAVVATVTRPGYQSLLLHVPVTGSAGLIDGELWNQGTPGVVSIAGHGTPRGQATGSLTGVVRAGTRPLAGVTVTVKRTGRGSSYTTPVTVATVKTDADGRARVDGLPPANYCMVVRPASGYAHETPGCLHDNPGVALRVFAGSETPFYLSMAKTGAIAGTVTDSRGKAVKQARVSAYTLNTGVDGVGHLRKVASVRADDRGRYTLRSLASTGYLLRVSGPDPLKHRTDWWRDSETDFTFDSVWVDSSKTVKRNVVIAAYLPMGTPRVSGTARVGSTLSATHPKTDGARYTYQWRADGASITRATSSKFTVTRAQAGKRISVVVTGTRSGYATTKRVSTETSKVAG